MRAGYIAALCLLAVAVVPGLAHAGRLVSDPDAGSPDLVGMVSRNPTLVVPRIYGPDGSLPGAFAQPGTADDDAVDLDSNGPDADSPDADIPDLPDSGAVAVNPENDPAAGTPDGYSNVGDNQGGASQDGSSAQYDAASNPDVGNSEDYQDQVNQAPPAVVMGPARIYSPPSMGAYGSYYAGGATPNYGGPVGGYIYNPYPPAGAYNYNQYRPTSAYIPIDTRPSFARGMGSPPVWNATPFRPMAPIGRPAWSPAPTMRFSSPMGMRSFPAR